jgi:pimeloyl-ACP methyl ester carboxylesterase
MSAERITLHGHDVHYRREGWGPPILLIHGVTGSSETWEDVIPFLSERHTVIAPDLLGHGDSAKPRGDYSLGAYASGIRDLMQALGHESATVVGHSLGGGVAMQFAYQFPEMCQRLVLVSSGGLGREVSIFLRAATLPGSEWVLPLLASNGVLSAGGRLGGVLRSVGLRAGPDLSEMWKGFSSLGDAEARQAFIYTLRGIVDPGGQRVSARDRLYLAQTVPTMLVWGERDPIIPAIHAYSTHKQVKDSRLEVMEDAGHFPYRDDPRRFAGILSDFIEETDPAEADWDQLRELLRGGG